MLEIDQQTLSKINIKVSSPDIIVKLLKTKQKQKILKAAREKLILNWGTTMQLMAQFLSETTEARKQWNETK